MKNLFTNTARSLVAVLGVVLAHGAALAQSITGFAPTFGVAGTSVTLTGTGFAAVTSVRFNGVQAASFAATNATTLTAVVPTGATTGTVTVSNGVGTVSSSTPFTVYQPGNTRVYIDGYREVAYGAALALQTTPTGFGNATTTTLTTATAGSELDAAYARVSNDTLFVLLTGNLEDNGNNLDIFFDSQAGGQNVLAAQPGSASYNNMAGLQFDAGFTADYHLAIDDAGSLLSAQFLNLNTGVFTTHTTGTGRAVTLPLGNGRNLNAGINNLNTGGVNGTQVGIGWPAAVVAGIEFALPLAALGNPTGSLRMAAFVNSGDHGYTSNQVLAGLPNGTANLAQSSLVNFASAANAGNQYFTVNVPASTAPTVTAIAPASGATGTTISLSGTNLTGTTTITFSGTSGNVVTTGFAVNAGGTQLTNIVVPAGATTGPVTVTTSGGSGSSSTSFTVTGGTLAVTGFAPANGVGGTVVTITGTNLTGTTAVSFGGVAAAGFAVLSSTSLTATVPATSLGGTVAVSGGGSTASSATAFVVDRPTAGRIRSDGYRESLYGAALAVQTTATGFGNAANGDPTTALMGSELDGAYARVSGDSLFVFVAGNLENNGNALDVFFDSQAGGQNVLTATNPTVDNNALGAMTGLQFDAGFAADYYLTIKTNGPGTAPLTAAFAALGTGGASVAVAATGTGRAVALTLPNGRTGTLALDNANTGGVSDTQVGNGWPAAVVRGLEFVLPLAALGSPTGSLKVAAILNNGAHDYLSNQILAGLPNGTANLATAPAVNFASAANTGNQFFTVNIPAVPPTVTALTPTSGPAGSTISLTGTNLTGTTTITFAGTGGNTVTTGFVVNAGGTGISGIVVPAGATSGLVTVTSASGTSTGITFTVTAPQLAVTQGAAAYPSNGAAYTFAAQTVGTTSAPVTFTLTNAGTAPLSLTSVSVTGPFALAGMTLPSVPAGGSIGVQVRFSPTGTGAQTGTLVIVSSLGTYTVNLNGNSSQPVPTVSGLNPASGAVGTTVTVTGTGFAATGTTVSLNGVAVSGATVNAGGTTVTFTVPAGATAGAVAIATPGGAATNTPSFCVQYAPTATAAALCGSGPATIAASGAPTGGTYYYYTTATGNTPIAGATGPSYTTPSLTATTTYYVSVLTGTAGTGCEGPRTAVTATVNALPTAPALAPVSVCGNGPVTLAATGGAAGNTYAYYLAATGGTAIAGATGANYTTPSLTATTTYYVSTISAAGCESPRTAVVATVVPLPTPAITAGGPTTFCQGGSVVLTASGGPSYLWNTGQTTPTITVTSSGIYSVTVTNAATCAAISAVFPVTVNQPPTTPAVTQPTPGTLTSSAATGNQWYLNGTAIPNATNNTYVVPGAAGNGTYTVVATSAAGCASFPSVGITVTLTATAKTAAAEALQVFPNPAQGTATVLVPALGNAATLTLLNPLGQVVQTQTLAPSAAPSRLVLDVQALATGVYLLRVQAPGTVARTQRLVVK